MFITKIPLGDILEKKDVTKDVTKNVTKDVTKEMRKEIILNLIKKNQEITNNEIAENLNLNRRTIIRDIEELKNENKIIRIGGRKTGYCEIVG